MRKLGNSAVPRISRGSTVGSDMPSALGLVCNVAQCPYNWGMGSAFHPVKIHPVRAQDYILDLSEFIAKVLCYGHFGRAFFGSIKVTFSPNLVQWSNLSER